MADDERIEQLAKEKGFLNDEQIESVRQEANARFIRHVTHRPWRLLGKIRDLEDLRYATRVAAYGLRVLRTSSSERSTTAFLYSGEK